MPAIFHVGVKAIIRAESKVLLLQATSRQKQYYWDLPGGRMQGAETVEETLIRELGEEIPTIKNIRIGPISHAHRLPAHDRDGHKLLLLFFHVSADLSRIELSHEHTTYRWITAKEISKLKLNPRIKLDPWIEQTLQLAFSQIPRIQTGT